jgi:hypothetical protein
MIIDKMRRRADAYFYLVVGLLTVLFLANLSLLLHL